MTDSSDLERDLQLLEVELRKLEAEYNMFFRAAPEAAVGNARAASKRWSSASTARTSRTTAIGSGSPRCRRGSRHVHRLVGSRHAFPRGRAPGPFGQRKPAAEAPVKPQDRVVHVTAFREPLKEMDKLHDLYDRVVDARRELGEEGIPFHKFADLVKSQVTRLRKGGIEEVAFRVSVKDGRVNFTARGLKGSKGSGK